MIQKLRYRNTDIRLYYGIGVFVVRGKVSEYVSGFHFDIGVAVRTVTANLSGNFDRGSAAVAFDLNAVLLSH